MSAEQSPHRLRGVYRGVLGASLLSLAVSGLALVAVTSASAEANKVTLCHATGSESNPYVEITVAAASLKVGHGSHSGDIIPAYKDKQGHEQPGQNLEGEGSEILANGCKVIKPSESTSTGSPTSTPTTTPTSTPTESTVTQTAATASASTITAPPAAASSAAATVAPTEAGGTSPSAQADEGGSSASSTAVAGNQGASGPTSANAGGGSESGSRSTPMWAIVLLVAGIAGTVLSSIGLARKK